MTAFFLPVVEKSYQVYVLQNEQGKFYIGLSEDVDARLLQHNNGESKWTSKYRPWRMAWTSASPPFGSAQGLELAETAPHETGEAFQTFVRREDTPALP